MERENSCIKTLDADGVIVEYQLELPQHTDEYDSIRERFYNDYGKSLDELDRLTNHADGLDYALAASAGAIAGAIDIFFVGELGLFTDASESAKSAFHEEKGHIHEKMNRFIERYAKRKGYEGNTGLKGAIEYLEKKYPVLQDNVWSGKGISSTKTHHLDDLAHHPSLLGLLSSIMVQYTRVSTFAGKNGQVTYLLVETEKRDLINNIIPIVISGLLKWLMYMAEKSELVKLDEDMPKPLQILIEKIHLVPVIIPMFKIADNWFGHLVSDMGGSKNTPGGGTGISGVYLSFFKEVSMLPGLKDSTLPQTLNDLYQGTKLSPLTDKLDLRAELTVLNKQKLPVIVNEVVVRTIYMVSHLIKEVNDKKLAEVNWNNVIPLYNRTIVRMVTISTGTMEAIDVADAAVRAAIKSGGTLPGFAVQFCLRINFVGIGRFGLACATDTAMGLKKSRIEYAVASAEVAIAADKTLETIEKVEKLKQKTSDNMQELRRQTEELEDLQF